MGEKVALPIDNVRESLGLADPSIYFKTRSKIEQGCMAEIYSFGLPQNFVLMLVECYRVM